MLSLHKTKYYEKINSIYKLYGNVVYAKPEWQGGNRGSEHG